MMFRTQLASLIFVWFFCAFASFWFLQKQTPDAAKAYQRLMDLSDQVKSEESEQLGQPVQQTRYEVSKQMLYTKDRKRLQSRLSSEKSELVFKQPGDGGGLIEYFTGMTCTMQEKPQQSGNEQHLRTLKARQAVYSYQSGQLEAEDVAVADYLVPGDQWPHSFDHSTPCLQGVAKRVDLSLFKTNLREDEK